jgi:hypothetical protein
MSHPGSLQPGKITFKRLLSSQKEREKKCESRERELPYNNREK